MWGQDPTPAANTSWCPSVQCRLDTACLLSEVWVQFSQLLGSVPRQPCPLEMPVPSFRCFTCTPDQLATDWGSHNPSLGSINLLKEFQNLGTLAHSSLSREYHKGLSIGCVTKDTASPLLRLDCFLTSTFCSALISNTMSLSSLFFLKISLVTLSFYFSTQTLEYLFFVRLLSP
jgi:hypothetical protein